MKVHENPDEIVSRFIQAKVDDQKNLMSFHCQVCKQTFSKESHTNAETNQLEIVCQHGNCPCKATFTDLKNFMLHHKKVCQMRYGLANFDMRVNCDECGKECPNSKQLVAHKHRYHPGPDSLMCQYCGQAFGLPHMLEFHMLTHTTERNIQCHICGNKYKYKSILRTHLAICHSEPRFPCDVCEKKFKTREHLRKHKFCVHSKSEPKFPCHICGKLFKSREYVINHIYSTHEKRRKPRDKKSSNHDGVGDNDNNTDCNSN
ncbi:unnamed protein product [Allacma fusca]|uniref:C2H2-type domain-containing protein n=1 Tax=Allacma fusca TaxID=39272 RepID=A0A8J2M100_9HEXA|nr:unnamed protein product [Allacma fusca]